MKKILTIIAVLAALATASLTLTSCKGSFEGSDGPDYIDETGFEYETGTLDGWPIFVESKDLQSKRICMTQSDNWEEVVAHWGYTAFPSEFNIPLVMKFTLLYDRGEDFKFKGIFTDTFGYFDTDWTLDSSYRSGGFDVYDIILTLTPTRQFDDYADYNKPVQIRIAAQTAYHDTTYLCGAGKNHTGTYLGYGRYDSMSLFDNAYVNIWKAGTWCEDLEGNIVTEYEIAPDSTAHFWAVHSLADCYLPEGSTDGRGTVNSYTYNELYFNGVSSNQSSEDWKNLKAQYKSEGKDDDEIYKLFEKFAADWWADAAITEYRSYKSLYISNNKNPEIKTFQVEYIKDAVNDGKEFKIGGLILTVTQTE